MTKVVINQCYGGFTLSKKAIDWLEEHGVFNTPYLQENLLRTKKWMKESEENYAPDDMYIARDNPLLVECVETLKEDSFKQGISKLVVEEWKGSLLGTMTDTKISFTTKKKQTIILTSCKGFHK